MHSVTYATTKLCFAYGRTPVLRDLDLTFAPGTLHAIIGPNGSGKSTLLDLLAGHHAPTSGTVRINDTNLTDCNAHLLARSTATVPQEFSFNFPFTVFDAVLMGRHPHIPRFARPADSDYEAVDSAMRTMDVTHLSDRPLSELSGGEKQRTVFARALAQGTPGLLLDEPTSSMDIRHALAAMKELRRLAHTENRTVVAVLHDLNLAAAHCDHVTILHQGQVYAAGSPHNALSPATINDVFGVRAEIMRTRNDGLTITFDAKE